MTELPLGGTVETFRQTVALDAMRFGRKALLMQNEIVRGVADEAYDRHALLHAVDRASKYAWAIVAIMEYAKNDKLGWDLVIARVTQECLTNGEPSDRRLIQDIVEAHGD